MAYAYIQEVDLHQANNNTISAPSITPNAAGDQFIIAVVAGNSNTLTPTDNLGTHNIYTSIGSAVFVAANLTIYFWIVTSCQGGAQVITVNGSSSNISNILVSEYSGLSGAFSAIASQDQNGAPTGANNTTSTATTVPGLPAMVWGLAHCPNQTGTITAGTSPLAFILESGVLFTGSGSGLEDARITTGTSYAATFANTSGNQYCTSVIIFPEFGAGGQPTYPLEQVEYF